MLAGDQRRKNKGVLTSNAHLESLSDTIVHISPFGVRVTTPVTCKRSRAGKGAAGHIEWTFPVIQSGQGIVRGTSTQVSVQVVQLVLGGTICIESVRRDDRLDKRVSGQEVIDGIWREREVSNSWSGNGTSYRWGGRDHWCRVCSGLRCS